MNENHLQKPQQINVEQYEDLTPNSQKEITTYQPILQPILDKNDGKFYTFLEYGERVCLCLHLKGKDHQILLNNEGKPKVFYRYYLKSQLKPVLEIGKSPFEDDQLCFTFYTKFDRPQFNGHKPNSAGYFSHWVNVRDKHWIGK